MIRVIYRWRVEPRNQTKFKTYWEKTTTHIRETTAGARGSVLLQCQTDSDVFLSIARWDSHEDWQAFWKGSIPQKMNEMHSVAERLSVEAYDEIGEHTV